MTEINVTSSAAEDDPRSSDIDDSDYKVLLSNLSNGVSKESLPDPFAVEGKELKSMDGVSDAAKQRVSRQLRKAYDGKNGAKSKQHEGNSMDGYNLFGVVSPPYNLDYLAKLYTASAAHFAAVNAKVSSIVGLGYDFVDSHKAKDKIEDAETEADRIKMQKKMARLRSDVFDWLDDCNEELTFDEVLKNVFTDYEATGNGYFEIGRDINGQVGYIGHIPSKTMRVRKDRDGFVQIVGDRVRFFKHFGKDTPNPIRTDDPNPNEVIHIKKYNPENSYYGIPDIIAALSAVSGNEFATRYNLDYFENKAVPRYAVIIKGGKLGAQGQREIMKFFDSAVKGTNHRTILIPLPADTTDGGKTDFKMEPIEAGVQDASFVNYDKINLRTILMAEKTPMTKVGLAEGVNLAVARDADKTFKENVCRPEQRVLDKKLGKVFQTKTDLLRFKLNELTLTDEDTQSKIDERYLRMQTYVPNEIRARQGKTAMKGGDKVVDLKAQAGADAAAKGNRTRDANRSANATDSAGEGRNAKGDGKKTP